MKNADQWYLLLSGMENEYLIIKLACKANCTGGVWIHHTINTTDFGVHFGVQVAHQLRDDAQDAQWYALNNLPPLAFDHKLIIKTACRRLAETPQEPSASDKTLSDYFWCHGVRLLHLNRLCRVQGQLVMTDCNDMAWHGSQETDFKANFGSIAADKLKIDVEKMACITALQSLN
eukprot:1146736-Pelagomonas_calceolata.AAC.1